MESPLHQVTVDAVHRWLLGLMPGYVLRVKDGDGTAYKHLLQVMKGVEYVRKPKNTNKKINPFGIPRVDLYLMDAQHNPMAGVWVDVERPMKETRKKALESLGVNVVEVQVEDVQDLLSGVFMPTNSPTTPENIFAPSFRVPKMPDEDHHSLDDLHKEQSEDASMRLSRLVIDLQICNPDVRRRLWAVLDRLRTVESFYPTGIDAEMQQALEPKIEDPPW